MEYCGIKSDVCNKTELFCEAHCYRDSETVGNKNIPHLESATRTTSTQHGVGKSCAYRNFVNDFVHSRDNGYDFEPDEEMSLDLNSDVTMFEQKSQNFIKGQGLMPCEYNGVPFLNWGMKNIVKNDLNKENDNCSRNSLHWEEFFGNVFGYINILFFTACKLF